MFSSAKPFYQKNFLIKKMLKRTSLKSMKNEVKKNYFTTLSKTTFHVDTFTLIINISNNKKTTIGKEIYCYHLGLQYL